MPEKERKRLPQHPIQGQGLGLGLGLGETLLMDALNRTLAIAETDLGIHAVEVVAIDQKAVSFYSRYGFQPLLDETLHMYLSMKKIRYLA